jgi:hypothetical protein
MIVGREVRRVPAYWQHPKEQYPDYRTGRMVERYKPLYEGELYRNSVDDWDEECAKWKSGWRPDYCTDENRRAMEYEQWAGQRPHRDDYMPNWPDETRTHYMMYETTSEGTPISPAFATPEDLARWLADTGASSFGNDTATYEQWLNVCKGEFAPSAVFTTETGLISGVAATAL